MDISNFSTTVDISFPDVQLLPLELQPSGSCQIPPKTIYLIFTQLPVNERRGKYDYLRWILSLSRMAAVEVNGRHSGGLTTEDTSGLAGRERKPHEKGIVFRDFDVSVIESHHCHYNCQPISSKSKTLRILFALWSVFAAWRNRNDFGRWRTGSSRLDNYKKMFCLQKNTYFLFQGDGTWVLAEGFNSFLGKVSCAKNPKFCICVLVGHPCLKKLAAKKIKTLSAVWLLIFCQVLHSPDWPKEGRVAMLKLLAFGAEQDDIVLILHMDRCSIIFDSWPSCSQSFSFLS